MTEAICPACGRVLLRPVWKPGDPVWYHATPLADRVSAVVDSEPWLLGETAWVVRLRELGPEYARIRGGIYRATVPAAACWALRPRDGAREEVGSE